MHIHASMCPGTMHAKTKEKAKTKSKKKKKQKH